MSTPGASTPTRRSWGAQPSSPGIPAPVTGIQARALREVPVSSANTGVVWQPVPRGAPGGSASACCCWPPHAQTACVCQTARPPWSHHLSWLPCRAPQLARLQSCSSESRAWQAGAGQKPGSVRRAMSRLWQRQATPWQSQPWARSTPGAETTLEGGAGAAAPASPTAASWAAGTGRPCRRARQARYARPAPAPAWPLLPMVHLGAHACTLLPRLALAARCFALYSAASWQQPATGLAETACWPVPAGSGQGDTAARCGRPLSAGGPVRLQLNGTGNATGEVAFAAVAAGRYHSAAPVGRRQDLHLGPERLRSAGPVGCHSPGGPPPSHAGRPQLQHGLLSQCSLLQCRARVLAGDSVPATHRGPCRDRTCGALQGCLPCYSCRMTSQPCGAEAVRGRGRVPLRGFDTCRRLPAARAQRRAQAHLCGRVGWALPHDCSHRCAASQPEQAQCACSGQAPESG